MVRQQRTIAKEFVIEGLGLHTGNTVKMRVKPAPAGSGIKFVRVDLNPVVEIPAVVTSIPEDATSYRNTSISTGPAEIHTVEHVLATCYGLGIDNLVIEIDANEPPEPASGTYAAYVRAFEDAGAVNQGVPADIFTIDRAVTLKENGIEIHAVPADDFRVSFTIQYDNPQIGTQYASFTVSPSEILPLSGLSSPATSLSRVDLPAPLGPMIPTMLPGGIERSRCSSSSRSPNALVTSLISITVLPRRGPGGM